MAKARAETTIARPADKVWARIRDFGDVSWTPGVESCTLRGDERFIRMVGLDFEIVERLLSHDDAERTYSFCLSRELNLEPVFGPGHVVRDLEATITVTPKGESTSWVTFDVDTVDFMLDGTRAEYQGAVDNLKAELEG